MAGLGQGHETAVKSYQTDGLRDTDVLASPTLTNLNERGLMNGVIPITLNKYSDSARNTTETLNCASLSGTNEAILLVYFDPLVSGKIGFTYGSNQDVSAGGYPQSPTGHLVKQTVVLASARLHYSSSEIRIASIEDKRVFVRPGPLPVSSLINASGNASMPTNTFISGDGNSNLPITDLGFIFSRDPAGLGSYADGRGFYQSDLRIDQAGMGGAYQITPTHRQSIKTDTYVGSQKNVTLAYTPLESQDEATTRMIEVVMYKSAKKRFIAVLIQGLDYTVADNVVTLLASLSYTVTPTHVKITYTHAGHTGDVSP